MSSPPRIAVVTGAAGGIGRAISTRLARAGWSLALADRDQAGLNAVARELPNANATVHLVDLLDREAPESLLDEVTRAHGAVHLLVNNAGITVLGPLEAQTREEVERVLYVNLVAVAQLCRVFTPLLIASAPSRIVNIASFAGVVAFPMQAAYSASKFGVRGLSDSLRIELSDRGVGVSAVLPGTVATSLMRGASTYDPELAASFTHMMSRHGVSPDAVAHAVVACVERGKAEAMVGWDARAGIALKRWFPGLVRKGFDAGWRRFRKQRGERG
jgi:short-subunit dehydrogenase